MNTRTFFYFLIMLTLSSCICLRRTEFSKKKYYDFPLSKYKSPPSCLPNEHSFSRRTTPPKERGDECESPPLRGVPMVIGIRRGLDNSPLLASVNEGMSISERTNIPNEPRTIDYPENKIELPAQIQKKLKILQAHSSLSPKWGGLGIRSPSIWEGMRVGFQYFSESDVMLILLVLLSLLLPPLAVFIKNNQNTDSWFWITFVLCLISVIAWGWVFAQLGPWLWFTAAVIALLVVFDVI